VASQPVPVEAAQRAGERKSDRTRRRILDCAAQVLNRKGYAGTRLTEIATLAELRLPTLYYYFASREDLLEEVTLIGVRMTMAHVMARLDELPANIPAMDRICAAAGAHLEMVLQESEYSSAAMRNVGQIPAQLREKQLREQREYGMLWHGLLSEAAAMGELDPKLDPSGARMLLLGALNWAPEWWDTNLGTLEQIVSTAERLVRNGLTGA
jgi:TetR/AcrR family transcriptional regulator, cholesterol catabolism regulator